MTHVLPDDAASPTDKDTYPNASNGRNQTVDESNGATYTKFSGGSNALLS